MDSELVNIVNYSHYCMKILIDEMDDGWDDKLKELGFDAYSVKKLRSRRLQIEN